VKGQIIELMFYPFMMVNLLLLFHFLSAGEIAEIESSRSVLESSDAAIASSNLVLLNCTPDHYLGCVRNPGDGSYYIRRLATDGESVKELIFPAPG